MWQKKLYIFKLHEEDFGFSLFVCWKNNWKGNANANAMAENYTWMKFGKHNQSINEHSLHKQWVKGMLPNNKLWTSGTNVTVK